MQEYEWSHLDVALLCWNLDDEMESPGWEDVERLLDDLVDGAVERSVSLRLDDEGLEDRPPELIVSRNGDRLSITFASEEDELWPGEEDYDLVDAKRIVKLFYDEQRLDPDDGWEPA